MTSASEPYPGLRPFRKDEHAFFFGRYEHIAALYRLLDRGRLLAILGGSGSGKSSLILAGLLPLLEAEQRGDATARWTIISLRPGAHPIRRLATALLAAADEAEEGVQRTIAGLRHTSAGLGSEINRLLPGDNDVLILIDQFEELFRFADAGDNNDADEHAAAVARLSRDDESRRFIELLLTAAKFSARRIRIVMTMRSDFLGDCARYRGLAEAVSGNQYLAPWLDRDQQREAIVGPLLRAAGRLDADIFELTDTPVSAWSDLIEPQLVEQLLNDAGDEPDQLPVMQHALRRCWREADGERMTVQAYHELGGWGVILSNHADSVMQLCGTPRAATVERVFRALIECDGTGRATRRPCTIARLSNETGAAEADIRAIVAEFSSTDCSFLAPPTPPPDELIDIGHEALIRQWRKIAHPARGWLQEEARDGMLWQLLVFQAQTYAQNGEVLSPGITEQRLPWFRQRNEHWANRYGDQWPLVDKLMRASNRARIMARRKKSALKATAVAFFIVVLMIFVVTQLGHQEQAEAQAVAIGLQLEFPDGAVKAGDKKALLELANDSDGDARLAFITQVSKSPELAGRLARNAAMVTRALVGVDPDKREQVIDYVFGAKANVPQDSTTLYTRALLSAELAAPQAGEIILEALRNSTKPLALQRLAQSFAALPDELTEEYAAAAVAPFVSAMQSSREASEFKVLAEGLALLPFEKLNPAQAETVVNAFSAATRSTVNPEDLALLGYAVAALAPKLISTEAQRAMQSTGAAMQNCENSVGLKGLASGLAKLSVESASVTMPAAAVVTPFLAAMGETRDMRTLKRFVQGLAALPAGLEPSDAAEAQKLPRLLLDTLPQPPRSSDLRYFAEALATLPIDLTAEQAASALNPILAAMAETTDPYPLQRLAQGAAALAAYLTDAQAAQAVTRMVNALEDKGRDFYGLEPLGAGLAALTAALNKAQAEQAIEPILAAMENTPDPYALGLLAIGLAELDIDFSDAQTERALQPMLDAMQPTADANAQSLLREGLAALAPRLNAAQSQHAIQPVLVAMWETSDTKTLERLAAGLTTLTRQLHGAEAVQPLIDAIKIPWVAGGPDRILVNALRGKLQPGDAGEHVMVNVWQVTTEAKRQFGSEIDLLRPPAKAV